MTSARRHLLMLALLAASACLVAWDRLRLRPPAVSGAVARPTGTRAAAAPETSSLGSARQVAALRPRDDYLDTGGDAFPALAPPAPAAAMGPPPATEPPRPSAPPVPFTVIGKKLEQGVWEVYLAKGEQTYIATQGQVIGDDYRVEAIGPTQMTLIYLPLSEKQTLQTGAQLHD